MAKPPEVFTEETLARTFSTTAPQDLLLPLKDGHQVGGLVMNS